MDFLLADLIRSLSIFEWISVGCDFILFGAVLVLAAKVKYLEDAADDR